MKKTTQIVAFMYDKADTAFIMRHIEQSLEQPSHNLHYTVVALGAVAKGLLESEYKPILETQGSNIYYFDMVRFQFSKTPGSVQFSTRDRSQTLEEIEIGNIATHYSRKDLIITGCESQIQLDIAEQFMTRYYPVPVIGVFNGPRDKSLVYQRGALTFSQIWVMDDAHVSTVKHNVHADVCNSVVSVEPRRHKSSKENFLTLHLRQRASQAPGAEQFKSKALSNSCEQMRLVLDAVAPRKAITAF